MDLMARTPSSPPRSTERPGAELHGALTGDTVARRPDPPGLSQRRENNEECSASSTRGFLPAMVKQGLPATVRSGPAAEVELRRAITVAPRPRSSNWWRGQLHGSPANALTRTREPERVYRGESPAAGTHRADVAICVVNGGRKARQEVELMGPGSWHIYGRVRGQCRNGRAGLPRIRRRSFQR
jgi:hypothetical protein